MLCLKTKAGGRFSSRRVTVHIEDIEVRIHVKDSSGNTRKRSELWREEERNIPSLVSHLLSEDSSLILLCFCFTRCKIRG